MVRHRFNKRRCFVCDVPIALDSTMEPIPTVCRFGCRLVKFLQIKNFSAKLAKKKLTCICVSPIGIYNMYVNVFYY